MKIIRKRKQGKAKSYAMKRYGQIYMPTINMESLSVITKREGRYKVTANMVGSHAMIINTRGKLLKRIACEAIQELAYKKEIGPDCLVDVHLKGIRTSHVANGVWPPYRIKVENGIVISVEKVKR